MSKTAFTLAEVLITLGIIGVVASMSIPALINHTNKAEYVEGTKKAYAMLSQMCLRYEADNGSIESAFAGDGSASADVNTMNAFAPYLNLIKNCGSNKGCWYDTPLKYVGGGVEISNLDTAWNNDVAKGILANSSMIRFNDNNSSGCNATVGSGPLLGHVCGSVIIDINGAKGPNQKGRDYIQFYITDLGVYPKGSHSDGTSCISTSDTWGTSDGCTFRVIAENAINY